MGFLIFTVAVLCIILVNYKYGLYSFVSAGVFGFLIYSLPAVVGLKRPLYAGLTNYLVEAGDASRAVTLLAWIAFALTLATVPRSSGRVVFRNSSQVVAEPSHDHNGDYTAKILTALALSLLGIGYLVADGGALFFLAEREDQLSDNIVLIWRWVVVLGFAASVAKGNRTAIVIFLVFLGIVFLRGDRTIPAIAGAVFLVLFFRNSDGRQKLSTALSDVRLIASVIVLVLAIVFGKAIYLSLKTGSTIYFQDIFNIDLYDLAYSLEPFVTFDHISAVLDLNVRISVTDFVSSVLGNVLIIPSAFGVDTNFYNTTMTYVFPYQLNYGIAGNYWAHALTVGGLPMVCVFAAIYAVSLILIDRSLVNREGRINLTVAVIGALVAIYTHRNGLDNLLSFVRQILVASIVIYLPSRLLLTRGTGRVQRPLRR